MDLEIFDHTKAEPEKNITLIKEILNFAGKKIKLPDETEMSVTLMNNEEIHKINREYRNVDRPTDVISFAIEEDGDDMPIIFPDDEGMDMPEIAKNIGDIMISTEKVAEQAVDYGHSYERELGFLTVHGFLHLNGYDHMEPEDEKEMFGLQTEILDAYGLKR
ncbi:rRNA maturation RNase YbeY [Dellaglioa sp. P0083]|uniref:rRNA maturation RNase YbeY n=1 Tax=Dellaglioa kimchii TaxID=3344667 RepID=UPI0038D3DEDF